MVIVSIPIFQYSEGHFYSVGISIFGIIYMFHLIIKYIGWEKIHADIDDIFGIYGKVFYRSFKTVGGVLISHKSVDSYESYHFARDNNNTLRYFLTDKFIDTLREIRIQLGWRSYILLGLGFFLDIITLYYKMVLKKMETVYFVFLNLGIVYALYQCIIFVIEKIFIKMDPKIYDEILSEVSEKDYPHGLYLVLQGSGLPEKIFVLLSVIMIFCYALILILNIIDVIFGDKFQNITTQENKIHIHIATKLYVIPSLETERKFIYKNWYTIIFFAVILAIVGLIGGMYYFQEYAYSHRILFWFGLLYIGLFTFIYLFFVYLMFLFTNPVIFSHHTLLGKLDKLCEGEKKFHENIQDLEQGIIPKNLGRSLGNTFRYATDLQNYIAVVQEKYTFTKNTNFIHSIQEVIHYNITQYNILFEQILDLIDRNDDSFIGKSFQDKSDGYKNQILDLQKTFKKLTRPLDKK
ncbi:MAG: hypothetical protein GY828_08010 [Candidatus Gracilibacteria bacterium]|nr:hypothetical protein [Candidatus Gracilibacteria bacterium]